MRVECAACKELVVATFAVDGDSVRATCPACHGVTTAVVVRAVDDGPTCPKCGAKRSEADKACRSCGIAVDRMVAYETARDAAVPDVVRDAWTKATEGWNEPARHDELMRLVATNNCYAWAAGKYRTRRDAVSTRQLDRMRRAAEATMLAGATVRAGKEPKPYRATTTVLAMLIVAIAAGLLYAIVIHDNPPPSPNAQPLPAQPIDPLHPISSSTVKTR